MAQLSTDFRPDYNVHRERKRPGCLSLFLIVWSIVVGIDVLLGLALGVRTLVTLAQTGNIDATLPTMMSEVTTRWPPRNLADAMWLGMLMGAERTLSVLTLRLVLVGGMLRLIELFAVGLVWSWKRAGYYLYVVCIPLGIVLDLWNHVSFSSLAFIIGTALELLVLTILSLFVLPSWRYYD